MAIFIAWLFYSFGVYYVVHKPFSASVLQVLLATPEQWLHLTFSAAALTRTLLDIGVALWLTFLALGIGSRLLGLFALAPISPLETILYALGLGFGSLGLGTLFLGLVGFLQATVFYALAICLTFLTMRSALASLRPLREPMQRGAWPPRLIGLYLAVTIGLGLTVALLPATSWDGLFYHLTGPKLYLQAGQIRPGIDIPHLNFPFLFEMLFMTAMAMRGDVAATLLHFVYSFMLAGLVYVVARRALGVENGWVAVLFLFSMPMVITLAGWAYNDLAVAFYQVAALQVIFQWQRTQEKGWLWLSGVLSGLAMGLKYTSFVAPLVLVVMIAWPYRRRWQEAMRPLRLFTLPALLVASPWYLKNWLFTGNPVYPFVFGGRFWDGYRAAAYGGPGTGIGLDPVAWLRLPHDLTLGLQDASQDGPTGPFFLIFLPLLLLYGLTRPGRTAPPALRFLLFFALAQYGFWTIGVMGSAGLWQSRLLLPALVALCPVLAWILQDLGRFDQPQFSLRRFLNLTLGLGLALALLGQFLAWLPQAPLAYVLGDDSREAVLLRDLGVHYQVMTGMNALLPGDAVVTFLWEPRSYYCSLDCRPDSILDRFGHLEHVYGNAADIAAAWKSEGVTHVLLHQTGLDFVVAADMPWLAPQNMEVLQALRAHHLFPVADWGNYILYGLR